MADRGEEIADNDATPWRKVVLETYFRCRLRRRQISDACHDAMVLRSTSQTATRRLDNLWRGHWTVAAVMTERT